MTLLLGDCLEVMRTLDAGSVDAVVTDPPYGLEFMGKEWDSFGRSSPPSFQHSMQDGFKGFNPLPRPGGLTRQGMHAYQAWCETWAAEALRVLKPGGHLLAFGGTRTYHRLASGLEDAGFEIRDCLAWLYGSGFPKSLNLNGDWNGWGTALKPAYEPVVLARKPLAGTVAANVLAHGVGAFNIDGCRIETDDALGGGAESKTTSAQKGNAGWTRPWMEDEAAQAAHAARVREKVAKAEVLGRWPANVVLDPEAAEQLDAQSGERQAGAHPARRGAGTLGYHGWPNGTDSGVRVDLDSGGASRFFYCAKTSRAERNAGLDGFDEIAHRRYGEQGQEPLPQQTPRIEQRAANHHPTVKPVALMRWLARLTTPPGGTILDPFTGSGTTGIAAHLEHFRFIGIERDPDYHRIAEARIRFWQAHGEDGLRIVAEREAAERAHQERVDAGQLTLLEAL